MGAHRKPWSIFARIVRELETLHLVELGAMHAAINHGRKRPTKRDYVGMLLGDLVRAGALKRIRRGEYLVINSGLQNLGGNCDEKQATGALRELQPRASGRGFYHDPHQP